MVGTNLKFRDGVDRQGRPVYRSPYEIVGQLELTLGDPRLETVRATFSRLTQAEEIRALADPKFPRVEPGQKLDVPTDIALKWQNELASMIAGNRRIEVGLDGFKAEFARHLSALGIPDLATRLGEKISGPTTTNH